MEKGRDESREVNPDESAWLARAQAGDLVAFERLMETYVTYVRGIVALNTPVKHLVDEVAHETFVFAFKNIREVKSGTSFRYWLAAIAKNKLRATVKRFALDQKNQTNLRLFGDFYEKKEVCESKSAEDDDILHLQACLGKLPPKMKELVHLRYYEKNSSETIAGMLSQSSAWVRTSLFRMREQLRECVERQRLRSA